jgi:cell wall-associated NlpC family hydrolase
MKKNTLANLLLLTSVAFFTACSTKTPEVDKPKLTTLDIIGVDVSTGLKCTPSIDSLPLARTYPILENEDTPPVMRQRQVQGCVIDIRRPRQSNSTATIMNIEWGAKELLGRKYVWGATGPRTYDCSGFTQKIYRDAGITIPRVSRDQAKVGQYVSYNNLRKGDMVFFDTKKHRSGKVTHVGIYLGNGNFIHASSGAKKIVIFNFNEKTFYKKRFLWGRRVIQNTTHLASL